MSHPRGERGQAATEYVGLLLVVAAVLAVLLASGIASTISGAINVAVCEVAGADNCDRPVKDEPGPETAQDPHDLDGDGLSNAAEQRLGSDPRLTDSDRDNLTDPQERKAGTDPTEADSDGDGLTDGEELAYGDGLTDGEELAYGQERQPGGGFSTDLDPRASDSDGDGLTDGEEAAVGTDPTIKDSDGAYGDLGDGLTDGEEVERYGSDPTVWDSDGDGERDGTEVEKGADPTRDERNFFQKLADLGEEIVLGDPFSFGKGAVAKKISKKVEDLIGRARKIRRIGDAKTLDEAADIRRSRLDAYRKQLAERKRRDAAPTASRPAAKSGLKLKGTDPLDIRQVGLDDLYRGTTDTKLGSAIQKHQGQGNFPLVQNGVGDPRTLGREQLEDILSDPGSIAVRPRTGNAAGGTRIVTPDGRGATFTPKGDFEYFGVYR